MTTMYDIISWRNKVPVVWTIHLTGAMKQRFTSEGNMGKKAIVENMARYIGLILF